MRRRALLAATRIAATGSLLALAGCSGQSDDETEPSPAGSSTPTASATATPSTVRVPEGSALRVVEHGLERRSEGTEDELVAVAGVVENTGETAVEDVRVTARFLDETDAVAGTATAENGTLGAGSRWEIELLFGGNGADARAVVDYRLVVERS